MALKIEDVRVGDLVARTGGPLKGHVWPVHRVRGDVVEVLARDGTPLPYNLAPSHPPLERPPLKPGMWVRRTYAADRHPVQLVRPHETQARWWLSTELHAAANQIIPVAPPPGAEDKPDPRAPSQSPKAGTEGEAVAGPRPAGVEACCDIVGNGHAGPCSPSIPASPRLRAPASPYCVLCQANPGRTKCEECAAVRLEEQPECPHMSMTASVCSCPPGCICQPCGLPAADEPDPARWDRCQEGRVFVRGDVVIQRPRNRARWAVYVRDQEIRLRYNDGWDTPRAAAEWADEHLPEGR